MGEKCLESACPCRGWMRCKSEHRMKQCDFLKSKILKTEIYQFTIDVQTNFRFFLKKKWGLGTAESAEAYSLLLHILQSGRTWPWFFCISICIMLTIVSTACSWDLLIKFQSLIKIKCTHSPLICWLVWKLGKFLATLSAKARDEYTG